MPPFRMIGNIYFVGTEKLSCHLIDTGDGLILIDTGYVETAEQVESFHHLGWNVRAWGIANEDMMRRVYDAGADGMTVNFPDRLIAYRAECEKGAV